MKKRANNSTRRNKASKSRKTKEYRPLNSPDEKARFQNKTHGVTEAFINELIRRLIDWAFDDDNAYKIGQFLRRENIGRTAYNDYVNKYPDLNEAHKEAMQAIGDRREINAMYRKLDPTMVKYSLHHYCPDWRQAMKDQAQFKEETHSGGTFIIQSGKPPIITKKDMLDEFDQRGITSMGKNKGTKKGDSEPEGGAGPDTAQDARTES